MDINRKATFHRPAKGLIIKSPEGRRLGSLKAIPTQERREAALRALLRRKDDVSDTEK